MKRTRTLLNVVPPNAKDAVAAGPVNVDRAAKAEPVHADIRLNVVPPLLFDQRCTFVYVSPPSFDTCIESQSHVVSLAPVRLKFAVSVDTPVQSRAPEVIVEPPDETVPDVRVPIEAA